MLPNIFWPQSVWRKPIPRGNRADKNRRTADATQNGTRETVLKNHMHGITFASQAIENDANKYNDAN